MNPITGMQNFVHSLVWRLRDGIQVFVKDIVGQAFGTKSEKD